MRWRPKQTETGKVDFRWYVSPDLTWRKAAFLAFAITGLVNALYLSPLGRAVETQIARPISFEVRHWLGADPGIDPRIKIYGMDDSTVKYLEDTDLPFEDWTKVFESFAQAKPAAVFIDKVFGTPKGTDLERNAARIAALPYPIVAGSYVASAPVAFRESWDLTLSGYNLQDRLNAGRVGKEALKSISWLPIEKGFPYGPHPSVRGAFRYVGHIVYEGKHSVRALYRLSESEAIPSATLFTGRPPYFDRGQLFIGGIPVPLDAKGELVINVSHPSTYAKQTYALASVIKRVKKGEAVTTLPKDAVVVILPGMYTGDTDMAQTPFGIMPGGYLMTAMISSVLSGKWITVMRGGWLLILLGGILGLFLGLRLDMLRFWCAVVGSCALFTGLGLGMFAYASIEVPWFFGSLSVFSASLATFAEKSRSAERKVKRLREYLEGTVSPSQLNAILQRPSKLALEPAGRVVTIMFIDVVGFSLVAEKQSAEEAFLHLKSLLADLTETIHEFSGVVDKTLGDGILCFFGYNYDGTPPDADHARNALLCAIKIQRRSLERDLAAAEKNEPLYPIRIGINTSHVFIGDLGNTRRLDLTLIGHGVNFAKRLESSCDSHCVMIGADTFAKLREGGSEYLPLRKRLIQIKHHSELIEAYECDPVAHQPELRTRATAAYREFASLDRKEPRLQVEASAVTVSAHCGSGKLVDYSRSGLSVDFDTYLGLGVGLNLHLDSADGMLRENLAAHNLLPVMCEVRWGQPVPGGMFRLGLSLKNLNAEQQEILTVEIAKSLGSSAKAA